MVTEHLPHPFLCKVSLASFENETNICHTPSFGEASSAHLIWIENETKHLPRLDEISLVLFQWIDNERLPYPL